MTRKTGKTRVSKQEAALLWARDSQTWPAPHEFIDLSNFLPDCEADGVSYERMFLTYAVLVARDGRLYAMYDVKVCCMWRDILR